MKKSTIIMITLGIILGFFIGLYLYKINKVKEEIIAGENIVNNVNHVAEKDNFGEEKLVNNSELRITPNTKIVEKIYYKNCNHIITTKRLPEAELVNLNEEEFKKKNNEWEIQKFTKEEVTIYKEQNNFCNEHFLLKDSNGNLIIYKLNQQGEIFELFQETEIITEFLPEEDRENLKEGIKVYTKKELNKIIEDFE